MLVSVCRCPPRRRTIILSRVPAPSPPDNSRDNTETIRSLVNNQDVESIQRLLKTPQLFKDTLQSSGLVKSVSDPTVIHGDVDEAGELPENKQKTAKAVVLGLEGSTLNQINSHYQTREILEFHLSQAIVQRRVYRVLE